MHEVALLIHSTWRWIVLALGSALVVVCAARWNRAKDRSVRERRLTMAFIGAFDLQVLFGLLLYFWLSPTEDAARRLGLGSTGDGILRFWLMEHIGTMLLASAVLHVGGSLARRRSSPRGARRMLALSVLAALGLVVAAIPWPGRVVGRPLVRSGNPTLELRACPVAVAPSVGRLSETELYRDAKQGEVSPEALAYEPRFPLWSDGAEKRRWIRLPPNTRIDTSDPDAWRFPVGTRFWKEFSIDGRVLETRNLIKIGPEPQDWAQGSYAWEADGSDAVSVPEGRRDVLGTAHDIPTAAECSACHAGGASYVLGFSAIQLDAEQLAVFADRFSDPVVALNPPGDRTAAAALGALHANCGHCHNPKQGRGEVPSCYDPSGPFDLSLKTAELGSVEQTGVYRTGVGSVIFPGRPEESPLVLRMGRRGRFVPGMPPLARENLDHETIQLVTDWVGKLEGP